MGVCVCSRLAFASMLPSVASPAASTRASSTGHLHLLQMLDGPCDLIYLAFCHLAIGVLHSFTGTPPDPFPVLFHTPLREHTVSNEAVASNAVAHRDGPAVYRHRESKSFHALAYRFPGERGVVGIRLW